MLLGFLREMWRYIRYCPNLRAILCTPPEAKGTMKIQAWGWGCKWFCPCPRYGVVAANRPQELQYLTHLILLSSRRPQPTWSPGLLFLQVVEYKGL